MNLSLFLFLIGILGFILNRKNIILMIIAIEIMLLAVTNNVQLSLPSIIKNKTKTNWLVITSFTIVASLNHDNYNMFIKINLFFGVI